MDDALVRKEENKERKEKEINKSVLHPLLGHSAGRKKLGSYETGILINKLKSSIQE